MGVLCYLFIVFQELIMVRIGLHDWLRYRWRFSICLCAGEACLS